MINKEYTDSPYYLGNRELPPIQIIMEYERATITRTTYWDAGMEELIHAFYTCCTYFFDDKRVLLAMKYFKQDVLGRFREKAVTDSEITKKEDRVIASPLKLSMRNGYGTTSIDLDASYSARFYLYELCKAFYTLCIGLSLHPSTITDWMEEFAEEKLESLKDNSEDNNEN